MQGASLVNNNKALTLQQSNKTIINSSRRSVSYRSNLLFYVDLHFLKHKLFIGSLIVYPKKEIWTASLTSLKSVS
ncbi:hypothetical protein L596_010502 [Steinernema carpocapsae]|uniref:Uncharacterized protein n=1 Tax=Steinernema carpocapsae TaxID=34508 RepID=A0A4U5PIJ5_STECR|nr:hypothetical protein L596_010502 [Steinernema carpocapsae]